MTRVWKYAERLISYEHTLLLIDANIVLKGCYFVYTCSGVHCFKANDLWKITVIGSNFIILELQSRLFKVINLGAL